MNIRTDDDYMRKKNVMKSFKYGFVFSILIMAMTFWVRKVFFDSLGTELTGYYLLINQMLGFLNLAELGLGTASTYLLFKPLNDNNNSVLSSTFIAVRSIYNVIQKVILGIGLILCFLLPYIVKSSIDFYNLYLPWILFVFSTSLSYSYSAESILLTADQKVYYLRLINGVARVTCFLLQIAALKLNYGFIVFSMLEVMSVSVQMYFFKKIVKQQYTLNSEIEKNVNVIIKKNIFAEIKKTFIHKISGVLIFNTDYIIISIFLGLSSVTSYSSYIMLAQAMSFIITTLSVPLNSALGNYLHEKGSDATYEKFVQINVIFMCWASIFSFCYFTVSSNLITLWLGEDVVLPQTVVSLLALNCFCLIARTSVDIFKVAYGYMSDTHLPIMEGLLNLIFSLILVHFFGIKGVVIGTIISNICIVMAARPYYLYKKAFGKTTSEFVKHHILVWSLSLISIVTLYLVLINQLNVLDKFHTGNLFDFIINCMMLGVSASIISGGVFLAGSKALRELLKQHFFNRT